MELQKGANAGHAFFGNQYVGASQYEELTKEKWKESHNAANQAKKEGDEVAHQLHAGARTGHAIARGLLQESQGNKEKFQSLLEIAHKNTEERLRDSNVPHRLTGMKSALAEHLKNVENSKQYGEPISNKEKNQIGKDIDKEFKSSTNSGVKSALIDLHNYVKNASSKEEIMDTIDNKIKQYKHFIENDDSQPEEAKKLYKENLNGYKKYRDWIGEKLNKMTDGALSKGAPLGNKNAAKIKNILGDNKDTERFLSSRHAKYLDSAMNTFPEEQHEKMVNLFYAEHKEKDLGDKVTRITKLDSVINTLDIIKGGPGSGRYPAGSGKKPKKEPNIPPAGGKSYAQQLAEEKAGYKPEKHDYNWKTHYNELDKLRKEAKNYLTETEGRNPPAGSGEKYALTTERISAKAAYEAYDKAQMLLASIPNKEALMDRLKKEAEANESKALKISIAPNFDRDKALHHKEVARFYNQIADKIKI